jgi:hypothetical protein
MNLKLDQTPLGQRILSEMRVTRAGAAPAWHADIPAPAIEGGGYLRFRAKFRPKSSHLLQIEANLPSAKKCFQAFAWYNQTWIKTCGYVSDARWDSWASDRAQHDRQRYTPEVTAARQQERSKRRTQHVVAMAEVEAVFRVLLEDPDAAFQGAILSGCCAFCGRSLEDPVSVSRGIGPECWGALRTPPKGQSAA